jgi:hypothetical protein
MCCADVVLRNVVHRERYDEKLSQPLAGRSIVSRFGYCPVLQCDAILILADIILIYLCRIDLLKQRTDHNGELLKNKWSKAAALQVCCEDWDSAQAWAA